MHMTVLIAFCIYCLYSVRSMSRSQPYFLYLFDIHLFAWRQDAFDIFQVRSYLSSLLYNMTKVSSGKTQSITLRRNWC